MLVHGFVRVRCESCKDELLVAFSCKGREVCPSCNAKRAQVTAVHRVERVLLHVPYRQWTLSFPHRMRWVLLKEKGLLSDVLTQRRFSWGRLAQRKATVSALFAPCALDYTPKLRFTVPPSAGGEGLSTSRGWEARAWEPRWKRECVCG